MVGGMNDAEVSRAIDSIKSGITCLIKKQGDSDVILTQILEALSEGSGTDMGPTNTILQNVLNSIINGTQLSQLVDGDGNIASVDNRDDSVKVFSIKQTNSISNNGTITNGGTSEMILSSNPNRIGFEFMNLSNEIIMIQFGGSASATEGFAVQPNYGSYTMPNTVTTEEIHIWGNTTGQAYAYIEYTL